LRGLLWGVTSQGELRDGWDDVDEVESGSEKPVGFICIGGTNDSSPD